MFEYSEAGVTMAAVLDTRNKKEGDACPVKIRVTHKRVHKYYSTGKTLTKEEWETIPTFKRRTKDNKELFDVREAVSNMADRVKENVVELIRAGAFSFDTLNKRLGKSTGETLNSFFVEKMDELRSGGKVSTYDWYRHTLRSIILFERGSAGNEALNKKATFRDAALESRNIIAIQQITPSWLKRYEKHMIGEGKSYSTISMYMRALSTIMNVAKAAEVIKPSQHPFGKGRYEIPQHEGRNIALKLADIGKIVKYECETEAMRKWRDIWVFSYLCNGANMADLCKMRFSNIRHGDICFYRQKTITKTKKKKLIQAVITPEMTAIMERWGNPSDNPDNFVFPFLRGGETPEQEKQKVKNVIRLVNKYTKRIATKLGLGNISTYTARHSYASVLKRSGANIAFISESLGHNDLKTTENYLASFEQEERAKNAALLTNF